MGGEERGQNGSTFVERWKNGGLIHHSTAGDEWRLAELPAEASVVRVHSRKMDGHRVVLESHCGP